MTKRQTFPATIQDAGGGGAFVEVPFDVEIVGWDAVPTYKQEFLWT